MILIDVCELIVDCPHSTANDEGAGYPLIRTPNVGKGRLILDGVHRVSKQVYDVRNARAVPKAGDLILAREAPAGDVAIILDGQEVCLGQRTVLIRPDKSKVNPQYLTYYLLAPYAQHELTSAANGATVAHVNMPKIRGLKINLPDIQEQNRIAGILSAYDDLIATNQKQIALLEEAAQRIYKEWFIDFRIPGYEETAFDNGIPIEWHYGDLGEVAQFKRGKTITKDDAIAGDVPVIAGGLTPAYYHNQSNTSAPVVTVSGSGANAGFTRMYHVRVWASDCSFIDSYSTKSIYFVYCFLKANKQSIDNLQKGSAQPHVYAKDLNQLRTLIPSVSIVESFNEMVKPLFDRIAVLDKQILLLTEARERFLPQLI